MSTCKFFAGVFVFFFLIGCDKPEFLNTQDPKSVASELAGMNFAKLKEAGDYAGGSGCIMRGGKIVFSWGDINKRYDLKSTTKSIGVTALGLAIKDGRMRLSDKAKKYYSNFGIPPHENKKNSWLDKITLLNLATHTAGFDKPGGYAPLLFEPGAAWAYSDGGANWLADCLTLAYGRDLKDLMFDRVFTPLGITHSDLTWRDNAYREKTINGIKRREFGSGISANVKAMANIGLLYLRRGRWNGKQLIPENFVNIIGKPVPSFTNIPVANDKDQKFDGASKHYGLFWWNNADGQLASVPKDAYWSWGLHDSFIVVIPSLDIVVSRAGDSWKGDRKPNFYKVMESFLEPIVASVNAGAPYSNSTIISNIIWDDKKNIARAASGSDNWPITWGDDDYLYTAYGDGYGFDPKVSEKLSMGFAKVEGNFPGFVGTNIRSSIEQYGNGSSGKKASGMLSIDGVLYMWVRNIDGNGKHSQLAWSEDYGKTWQWSNWKFEEFGYSTFINFGKNYEGARDNYVYTISHNNESAYDAADDFVLLRCLKTKLGKKENWQFYSGLSDGKPQWSSHINERASIFRHRGKCLRSGISYNQAIGRFIWWQQIPVHFDTRYTGGFGIYEAPEPWGPWTTVFFTRKWDTGPGETGSFPTKWMSEDGKTMYLVFSGDDSFSVRKATLTLSPDANIK